MGVSKLPSVDAEAGPSMAVMPSSADGTSTAPDGASFCRHHGNGPLVPAVSPSTWSSQSSPPKPSPPTAPAPSCPQYRPRDGRHNHHHRDHPDRRARALIVRPRAHQPLRDGEVERPDGGPARLVLSGQTEPWERAPPTGSSPPNRRRSAPAPEEPRITTHTVRASVPESGSVVFW